MRRRELKVRLAIIFALIILLLALTVFTKPSGESGIYVTYTVRSGDTLWKICREFYGYEVDVRKKIDAVVAENGLGNQNDIRAGRVIYLELE